MLVVLHCVSVEPAFQHHLEAPHISFYWGGRLRGRRRHASKKTEAREFCLVPVYPPQAQHLVLGHAGHAINVVQVEVLQAHQVVAVAVAVAVVVVVIVVIVVVVIDVVVIVIRHCRRPAAAASTRKNPTD
jgi:hypothetical protein